MTEMGRVAPGDCSPGAPTDPDVRHYRIRFLKFHLGKAPNAIRRRCVNV
jgi:hypothetical protein